MVVKNSKPIKKVVEKKTITPAAKKMENWKAKMKDMNYKKLTKFSDKILKFVKDWKNAQILNDKAVVYTKLLNLLYTSVWAMLSQNLNTYSNSMYINRILWPKLQNTRSEYQKNRMAIFAKVKGQKNYEKMVDEINKAIAKLWDVAKIKKPTEEQKKLEAMVRKNVELRKQVVFNVDLKKEIQNARKESINKNHVIAIYEKCVKPIMEFLVQEPTINKKDLQELDRLLKLYVKDWTLSLNDVNFWIEVKYWPKEEVFGNAKMYWYKGIIWAQFREYVIWKEWKWSIKIPSWKEYIRIFRENMIYEKEKVKNEKAKAPDKQLFYPYFRSLVLQDHKKMQSMMRKFVITLTETLKKKSASAKSKEEKVDKKVIWELDSLVKRMTIWKMDLEIQRQGTRVIIKIDKDKKKAEAAKKPEAKKVVKSTAKPVAKKPEAKKVEAKKAPVKKPVAKKPVAKPVAKKAPAKPAKKNELKKVK